MTAWQSHPACWGSAHPNRLWLLVALLAGGEMCVCDLAAVTGMSESAASHAVRWLRVITGFERADAIASLIVVSYCTPRGGCCARPAGSAGGSTGRACTRRDHHGDHPAASCRLRP